MRGLQGGERFAVGLRGRLDAPHETKIPMQDVLPGGVSTEWRHARIPLRAFVAIQDWNDVNVLSLSFEAAFGSRAGAVLIDEVAFER